MYSGVGCETCGGVRAGAVGGDFLRRHTSHQRFVRLRHLGQAFLLARPLLVGTPGKSKTLKLLRAFSQLGEFVPGIPLNGVFNRNGMRRTSAVCGSGT